MFLDTEFLGASTQEVVTLKVSFSDHPGRWRVESCSASGVGSTPLVRNTTDTGGALTATTSLPAFSPSRCQTGEFELALVADS